MKTKKRSSLTGQLIATIVAILAGTVILCWLFNNTFLERYYIYEKEQELLKGFAAVDAACVDGTLETDDFDVEFETICANGNINMLVMSQTGVLLRSSYTNTQRIEMQIEDMIHGVDRGAMQTLVQGDGYLIQRQTDEWLESDYLILWGDLSGGEHVYMRTPLESIRESASITNKFFAIVSVFALIVSIAVAVIISRNISKPIRVLSGISHRMSNLDFDAKYSSKKHASREIEDLGQSMNLLSETLQETISELKTANVELQEDIEKKEQIDEMRRDFLSNVSHELKTPLALIQGYAEGLKECVNDDAESREFYSDVIIDESEKMNQMVKKLLTLNQLEFGNERVEMVRFDLTELIQGIIASSTIMAEQKHVHIVFMQADPVYVWGDEFNVEEVITNYLTNAMNHADGERRVVISLVPRGNLMRTSVFNTGEQIPEDELGKIWIKFYKVDKARTREYGGSGIGLSIVKAIMDSFHQECGVINHPDGVEFWMELERDVGASPKEEL